MLGVDFAFGAQMAYDTKLEIDLEVRAETTAKNFKLQGSEVEKGIFEEFIRELQARRVKLILLEGQVNPILAKRILPEVRADMKLFLSNMEKKYSNVILVTEEQLPKQRAEDYDDLTHVKPQMRNSFSLWFTEYLRQRIIREGGLAGGVTNFDLSQNRNQPLDIFHRMER